jgi:hypothetical protein
MDLNRKGCILGWGCDNRQWLRSHVNVNLRFGPEQRSQRWNVLFHELFTRGTNRHVICLTGQQLAIAPRRSRTQSNGTHPHSATMMALNVRKRTDKSSVLQSKTANHMQ